METNLQPVRTATLADEVEGRLRAFLRDGGYRPGDALPGEVDLAKRLDVSRNVVREALSRLRMLGLIASRKRRGMVLGRPDVFAALERVLDLVDADAEESRDLAELRLVVELGMTDLVLARATDDDLAALEAIVAREADARGLDERVACDRAFHERLFAAAGNRALARLQGLLHHFFHRVARAGAPDHPAPPERAHRRIVEALRSRDRDALHETMRTHLSVHLARCTDAPTADRSASAPAQPTEEPQ